MNMTNSNSLNILGISGSLRKGSYNTALLYTAAELMPPEMALDIIDLAPLPMFNQDFEKPFPEAVAELHTRLAEADGVLIATPEYNSSLSGAIKNAIDWASRAPQRPLKGKPAALMGPASATAEYPIALSRHGLAPRAVWEDSLTPEGEFLIASMQYKSIFGPRQMLLETTAQSLRDYVTQYGEAGAARITAWEAKRGTLDTIREVYDFNKAHQEHRIWNDILVHGGGAHNNWTLGCITLDDADMVELCDFMH